jgi:hypothetical protein
MTSGAIYVFAADDGDALPRLVAEARLVAGVVECADPGYRAWLEDGVRRICKGSPAPTRDPELARFIEALCDERSGTRLFAAPTPIL